MADVAYIPGEPGRERRPALGYAMVISAALLFALNGTVSKVVLQSGISSLELTQVRATGAFLGFALLLAFTRRDSLRLTRRELPYLVVFGIAGVALVQWLYFVSIERLPIGIALLLEYLGPILIALWAWAVYKEPIRRRLWLALVLAVVGLSLVVEFWSGLSLDGLGVVAALSAAVAYAIYVLMAEHAVRWRDPASLTAYGFLFAALFWAVVHPVWRFPGRAARRQRLASRPPRAVRAPGVAADALRRRRRNDDHVPARRCGAPPHLRDEGRDHRDARACGRQRRRLPLARRVVRHRPADRWLDRAGGDPDRPDVPLNTRTCRLFGFCVG